MPNEDTKNERNINRTLHNQLDTARMEGKMNPPPRLHFSTWLIDTFAHGDNTQGLLVVFPFEVSKRDERRKRFEEAIQRGFEEIYL